MTFMFSDEFTYLKNRRTLFYSVFIIGDIVMNTFIRYDMVVQTGSVHTFSPVILIYRRFFLYYFVREHLKKRWINWMYCVLGYFWFVLSLFNFSFLFNLIFSKKANAPKKTYNPISNKRKKICTACNFRN